MIMLDALLHLTLTAVYYHVMPVQVAVDLRPNVRVTTGQMFTVKLQMLKIHREVSILHHICPTMLWDTPSFKVKATFSYHKLIPKTLK